MLRTILSLGILYAAACGAPPVDPAAFAARGFHPVGALYFLPERLPVEYQEAALVPDSKIEWEARMIAVNIGLREVEAVVDGQIVTLRGRAPTDEAHDTFVKAVKRIHGVAGVRDDLEVTR